MQKEIKKPLSGEGFNSLENAEKNTEQEVRSYGGYTLKDIINRVKTDKLSIEIKSNDDASGRTALVKGGDKLLFATSDEGEVEILKLIKEGKHVPIDWPLDMPE